MRSLLTYLVLVGVPFLGLLGILRVGDRLVPPRSIGGTWEMEAALPTDVASCLATREIPPTIEISQSGVHAQLAVVGERTVTIPVDLDVDSVSGATPVRDCAGEALTITARLSASAASGPPTLTGTLALLGCVSCAPATFRAVRRADEAAL